MSTRRTSASTKRALIAVSTAEADADPFDRHPLARNFQRGGLSAELQACTSSQLSPKLIDWAVRLVDANVGEMSRAVWGWNEGRKRADLLHPKSRFVLANDGTSGEPIGFLNYRWEVDPLPEDRRPGDVVRPIVYIYDLQLAPGAQGHGLGSFMVQLLTQWAEEHRMEKVMLTCFQENAGAQALYARLGFEMDESTPDPKFDPDLTGYDILSKRLSAFAS